MPKGSLQQRRALEGKLRLISPKERTTKLLQPASDCAPTQGEGHKTLPEGTAPGLRALESRRTTSNTCFYLRKLQNEKNEEQCKKVKQVEVNVKRKRA